MKADRLRRYDEESSRELPTKFDVLGGALVLLAFIGCGIAGGYIADAIAHPDSDYAYGDGLGRLILGFFIGAIAGGLLTGAGWTALDAADGANDRVRAARDLRSGGTKIDQATANVSDVDRAKRFYSQALAPLGGKDNGAPGLRPHYHENFYAAFLHDADGNNIEAKAVCHLPE